ncbi:MAG: YhfG family protein [Cognaticolwellia sp.]
MALSSLAEKVEYVKQSRAENYRHSLRLEGVNKSLLSQSASLSKKDLIAKYKELTS